MKTESKVLREIAEAYYCGHIGRWETEDGGIRLNVILVDPDEVSIRYTVEDFLYDIAAAVRFRNDIYPDKVVGELIFDADTHLYVIYVQCVPDI